MSADLPITMMITLRLIFTHHYALIYDADYASHLRCRHFHYMLIFSLSFFDYFRHYCHLDYFDAIIDDAI